MTYLFCSSISTLPIRIILARKSDLVSSPSSYSISPVVKPSNSDKELKLSPRCFHRVENVTAVTRHEKKAECCVSDIYSRILRKWIVRKRDADIVNIPDKREVFR